MTLFQAGVGSGGIIVLDLLMRESAIQKIILIDPDVYQLHNVYRHSFPASSVGQLKVELAASWIREFRPDVEVIPLPWDLLDPSRQESLKELIDGCQLGICAVDSEPAKYQFDLLMRTSRRSWTMGEVLSGGIGGWVHRFQPGEACYGCLASHLQRTMPTDNTPPPIDYTAPTAHAETSIPANKSSISVIASLQALISMDVLSGKDSGFTSLLLPMTPVTGIFTEALRPFRFRVARSPDCLICGKDLEHGLSGEQLDVALDQALARLAYE